MVEGQDEPITLAEPTLVQVPRLMSAMCMKLGGSNGHAKYYHCAEIIKILDYSQIYQMYQYTC